MSKTRIVLFIFLLIGMHSALRSQEIKIFELSDFDLKGNVKSCLVITDYGKEEYHFDGAGRLTKSITRFSDSDYETTYYKYKNDELIERRVENYRHHAFDKTTSIANFYDIDTTANREVTEKIVSYTSKLLEQNVYQYNHEGKLTDIISTDMDGTDETSIVYDTLDEKTSITRKLNGRPLKSVQSWDTIAKDGSPQQVKLTETYFDGTKNTKTEEIYNNDNKLISSTETLYDDSSEKWILQEEIMYTYDENDMLSKSETQKRNAVSTKNYIYQFDGSTAKNWVKEIVTPDNTYKTRRITYYEVPDTEEKE